MRDPWANLRTTGTWADHASYSLGGIDKPLDYGTALIAPASGVLHTSGRPRDGAEFQAGQVGSAGRRSVLILDEPLQRVAPASDARMLGWYTESDDPMVALVFQHQSRFGTDGHHYDEGDKDNPIGWSGASANGSDWGGDVHLHWHGLTAAGERVNPLAYIGSSIAGDTGHLISNESEEDAMAQIQYYERAEEGYGREWMIAGLELEGGFQTTKTESEAVFWSRQYRSGAAPLRLDRKTYIATQGYWRTAAAKYQAGWLARIKSALGR